VRDVRIGTIIDLLRGEQARKVLLGTDESDSLANVVAGALLEQASKRYGKNAKLSDVLRELGDTDNSIHP